MTTTRTWHPSKRAWARAKLPEIDASIAALQAQYFPAADWRKIRAKSAAIARLRDRRARLACVAGVIDVDRLECEWP